MRTDHSQIYSQRCGINSAPLSLHLWRELMRNMDQGAHGREQLEVTSTIKEPQSAGENDSVESDGIDRRNFLSCMAWAGTGLLWTVAGGIPTSRLFAATGALASKETHSQNNASLTFVQISDSHIGFNKAANQDVTGTFKLALDKINRLPNAPDLLLHTGDITHSSKTMEFDTAQQLIKGTRAGEKFFVPGEHDTASDDGAVYLERFGKGTMGRGWYSFSHKGVHFIGLNNVLQIDAMGRLGPEQLSWLKA